MPSEEPNLTSRLMLTRLLATAMMSSLLLMAGVVLFLVHGADQKIGGVGGFPAISAIAAGCFAIVVSSLLVIIPALNRGQLRMLVKGGPGESDADRLLTIWNTNVTILFGLLEGPSLLGLIAYLLEHQPFVLAVPGVGLLLMLAFYPTDGRFRSWLQRQRGVLDEMRQSGPAV